MWFGYIVVLSSFLLQLYNVYLGQFWPLSVAISISLGLSLTVFIEFFRPKPLERKQLSSWSREHENHQ